MRHKIIITFEIDTCTKCPHLERASTLFAPKCSINQFYIPTWSLEQPEIDIPTWCPVLNENENEMRYKNGFLATADTECTKRLRKIFGLGEREEPKIDEEARNIDLD